MKTFPAIRIRFSPEAETAVDLRDRLLAGLDDFEPSALEESATHWRVFFEAPATRAAALDWLRALGDRRVAADEVDVEDEDWARRTQADLQPVRIGRIVVTPPWSADDASGHLSDSEILIVVVPSTGFGTGHHASTRLCLALLQQIPLAGRRVLDIGTGSGVLAIAAARLGASAIAAVDNDSDAIEAARENLSLNPLPVPVRLECADFRAQADSPADVVVANLTGELLRRTAREVVGRTATGGDVILSGVLAEERATVVAAFETAGVVLQQVKAEDEWVGLHFRKERHAARP